MGLIWRDVVTRLKRRPAEEDLWRSSLRFGDAGFTHHQFTRYREALNRIDPIRDWISEWKSTLRVCITAIAQGQTRNKQAEICRREILKQIELCAIGKLLLELDDEHIRDYWLELHYVEHTNLDNQGRINLLIIHRTFALLRLVGLNGLYEQQFNGTLNEGEFVQQYQVLSEAYCEILLKSLLSREHCPIASHPTVSLYADLVANPLRERFRAAKEEFAECICTGNKDQVHSYRLSLASLFQEYGSALDELKSQVR